MNKSDKELGNIEQQRIQISNGHGGEIPKKQDNEKGRGRRGKEGRKEGRGGGKGGKRRGGKENKELGISSLT